MSKTTKATQEQQQAPQVEIHSRAMLVKFSVSVWTARRFDKKVTAEVNTHHGASADAGRYNKHLLGDAESYKAVVKASTDARTEHYANTLAWSDEGWRMLPTANYLAYTEVVRKNRAAFEAALQDFFRDYPRLRENAKSRLNGMYNEQDYPSADAIHDKFAMSAEYSPVPASGDFRLDLPAEQVRSIAATVDGRVQQATAEAMKDAWTRLFDCVAHIHDRLNDPKAIFRDSLIGNAVELTDVLKRLNVTGDPGLEQARLSVERSLASLNPQRLRNSTRDRKASAQKADEILAAMRAMIPSA